MCACMYAQCMCVMWMDGGGVTWLSEAISRWPGTPVLQEFISINNAHTHMQPH